jgi:hypothetical protein
MKDATTAPEQARSNGYSWRARRTRHGLKIVGLIIAVAATFSLARQAPQQGGSVGVASNPGDVMTGIDYFPAQFGNSAANQAPEQHIQAF